MGYTKWIQRLSLLIVAISCALFYGSFQYVAKLGVRSNFKEMLPQQSESVVQLNRIESRVRSTDNLIILVGGAEWPTMRQFIDDFAARAKDELKDDIAQIEFKVDSVKGYYEHNKYLYIEYDDLVELYDRLKARIDWEKVKHTPLFLQFSDEEPKFETKDIEDKYTTKTGRYQNYQDGYLTNAKADVAAIIVWPSKPATDVEFSRKFIDKIQKVIEETPGYKNPVKIAYAGRVKKMIREYEAIVSDILKTTLLCFALCGILVLGYYRKVRMGALMIINIAQGTLGALAIAYFLIGYLTSQTAFLGSIIVGNGINYSLILMARYLEEKRQGKGVDEALGRAISQTWKPTFVAAVITSASFAALLLTKVQGLSQFGIIGGIGMVLCWACTYTVLPAWLTIFERVWETKVAPHKDSTLMERLSHFVMGKPGKILKVSIGVSAAALLVMAWYLPRSLEYDFSKLSFRSPKVMDPWEDYADEQRDAIFGQSASPSVVILDRADQGPAYCEAILAKDPKNQYIESCKTIDSFVPKQQEEKLAVLKDMRGILSSSTLKFLNEEQLKEVNKFKESFDLKPLTVDDLPYELTRMFLDIDGNRGLLAFVYPKADLWNGKELEKFASLLREVKLPNGEVIKASGQPVILSDLLQAVVDEGPKVTFVSFVLVLLLIWASFLRWRSVSAIQLSLLTGVLWLIGLMGLVGIKLNFLNFVALPITFGIGVDYAVNIYQRYQQDGPGSIGTVIGRTGGAVILCSLTTIIGYSVILTSRSRALQSFGLVALLGEFTCLAAALAFLPAFILWRERREAAQKARVLADEETSGTCSSTAS